MNKYNWIDVSDKVPTEPGYYYTYYYNVDDSKYFYKAIWWNGSNWVNWRPGSNKYIETVERYIKESRNDYYCPCVEWVVQQI